MSDTALVSRPTYELQAMGWRPTPALTYETWAAAGDWLSVVHDAHQWWTGDWLNYGEALFGERHAQALEPGRWSHETLRVWAWVCQRIPHERRVPGLTFGHHQAIAALDGAEQTAYLTRAREREWTVADLKRAVKQAKDRKLTWTVSATVETEAQAATIRDLLASVGYRDVTVRGA